MIIDHADDGALLLVRQPDHAVTCGQLAAAWRKPEALSPEVWAAFCRAAAQHDDGWIEAEKAPTLDEDGGPLDFKTISTALHADIWRRSVELAREQGDPFASLMIALHARLLYAHNSETRAADQLVAQRLMADLAQVIDRAIERMAAGDPGQQVAVEPKNLEAARRVLSFMDGLTLALLGAIDRFDATEPLAFGDVVESLTLRRDGDVTYVHPWPFEGEKASLSARCYRMQQPRFRDPTHLAWLMGGAQVFDLRWTLLPG